MGQPQQETRAPPREPWCNVRDSSGQSNDHIQCTGAAPLSAREQQTQALPPGSTWRRACRPCRTRSARRRGGARWKRATGQDLSFSGCARSAWLRLTAACRLGLGGRAGGPTTPDEAGAENESANAVLAGGPLRETHVANKGHLQNADLPVVAPACYRRIPNDPVLIERRCSRSFHYLV